MSTKRSRRDDSEEAAPRRRRDAAPPASPRKAPPAAPAVDRARECPFLLRLFWRHDAHHDVSAYGDSPASGVVPADEYRFYTWPDCTLRELTDLVKNEHVAARRPRCQLSFAIVYPDKHGRNAMKEVGLVWSTNTSVRGSSHEAETKTLSELRFQTGDFVDVAVMFPPARNQQVSHLGLDREAVGERKFAGPGDSPPRSERAEDASSPRSGGRL